MSKTFRDFVNPEVKKLHLLIEVESEIYEVASETPFTTIWWDSSTQTFLLKALMNGEGKVIKDVSVNIYNEYSDGLMYDKLTGSLFDNARNSNDSYDRIIEFIAEFDNPPSDVQAVLDGIVGKSYAMGGRHANTPKFYYQNFSLKVSSLNSYFNIHYKTKNTPPDLLNEININLNLKKYTIMTKLLEWYKKGVVKIFVETGELNLDKFDVEPKSKLGEPYVLSQTKHNTIKSTTLQFGPITPKSESIIAENYLDYFLEETGKDFWFKKEEPYIANYVKLSYDEFEEKIKEIGALLTSNGIFFGKNFGVEKFDKTFETFLDSINNFQFKSFANYLTTVYWFIMINEPFKTQNTKLASLFLLSALEKNNLLLDDNNAFVIPKESIAWLDNVNFKLTEDELHKLIHNLINK